MDLLVLITPEVFRNHPESRLYGRLIRDYRNGAAALQCDLPNAIPAAVTNLLLEHVSDALAGAGETGTVTDLLGAVLARGNGASCQPNTYRRSGHLPDIVTRATEATTH